jgi:hypothetical protein
VKKSFEVLPLFSKPIYLSEIEIKDEDIEFFKSQNFMYCHDHCCVSKDTKILDLDNPSCQRVKNSIEKELDVYTDEVLEIDRSHFKYYVSSSWVLRHKKGESSQRHTHSNAAMCGVLYFNGDDDSGKLTFTKDPDGFHIPYKNYNIYNSTTWFIPPKKGLIVIFPNDVAHYISVHNSDFERYSLTVDFFIKGTIGDNIGNITI